MTDLHADSVILRPNQGWDPRVLVCRCGDLVDSFIVISTRYVVLIDTLINARTASALRELTRPHLPGRQLLVVNSHADWDHAWGNQRFGDVPIIASRRCADRLRSEDMRQELAHMQASEPGRFDAVRLTPPTLLFDERFVIDGGDLTLELFATPGHQPDHIAVFIPEISTLLAGDAAEMPFPFVESAAALPALRDSLARSAALHPSTALYCHAPVSSGPTLLRQNSEYFDRLEQHCRAALTRGAPINPSPDTDLEELIGFSFAEAIPSHADVHALARFYQPGHHAAIRAMLEYLEPRMAP